MLRSLVLILLLVNTGFFAWSHGWLNSIVGVQPEAQHEPQRLQREVQADKLVILGAPSVTLASASKAAAQAQTPATAMPADAQASAEAASAVSSASATSVSAATAKPGEGTLCIEAGPFTPSEFAAAENHLRATLPAGSWTSDHVAVAGQWLIYMGPYPDPDQLERKQTELRRIKGLLFEEINSPGNLAHGLSLGRFNQLAKAEAALNVVKARGVRSARIVMLRPAMDVQVLRVPQASERIQVDLASMKLPQGKGFTACRS
jgi:hypothetical protein